MYQKQARKRYDGKREAVLHHIQQLTAERVMFAPIINLRAMMGVGSRVAEHAMNTIPLYPFPVPEDMRLKE